MTTSTTSQSFFEAMYREHADPWSFATSEYELSRYKAIVRALQHRRYQRAFEPGCSVGVLTEQLAALCEHVEAMEISPTAAARARERCGCLANVHIACGALPEQMPSGSFDLIVLSEIGYYFEAEELGQLSEQLLEQLQSNGVLLAEHWLGTSNDHILSGDHVHEILSGVTGLRLEHSERNEQFRLDRWIKG